MHVCGAAAYWEPTTGVSAPEFVCVTLLKSAGVNKRHVWCLLHCVHLFQKKKEMGREREREREEREQELQPLLRLSSTHNPIQ